MGADGRLRHQGCSTAVVLQAVEFDLQIKYLFVSEDLLLNLICCLREIWKTMNK